jgi:hypothetical protein
MTGRVVRNRKHGVRRRGARSGITAAAVADDYTGYLVDIARCDGYGGEQGKTELVGGVRDYFVRCLPCTLSLPERRLRTPGLFPVWRTLLLLNLTRIRPATLRATNAFQTAAAGKAEL